MKKVLLCVFVSVLLLNLVSCSKNGISQADYDEVVAKNEALEKENEQLKKDCDYYLTGWAEEKASKTIENIGKESDAEQLVEIIKEHGLECFYDKDSGVVFCRMIFETLSSESIISIRDFEEFDTANQKIVDFSAWIKEDPGLDNVTILQANDGMIFKVLFNGKSVEF